MPLLPLRVLVELNGADPVHVTRSPPDIRVDVLDYDEIEEMEVAELIALHDTWERAAPRAARSIRDHLRERGASLPPKYNSDFDRPW